MINSDKREIRINYGHGVIVLPEAVLGSLSSAKKNDIIILLTLLSSADAATEAIAEKCGVSTEAVERSIEFWRGAGIISPCEAEGSNTESEAGTEAKRTKTAKQGRRGDLGALPEYSSNEIADMVENDREVALMIDECERSLGKIFRVGETAKILALRDYLGFAPEYIIAICEYCASIGKTSVRYLETTAVSLYDDGITDLAAFEEHMRLVRIRRELESQIRSLFGMNMTRGLTAKEKRFMDAWITSFGYGIDVIKLAYEITIDTIHEPSLNYANAILESWNSKGLRTEDEVKAQLSADAEAKGEAPAGKSFDSTDFFEAALRRSYGESGAAPEMPRAAAETKKKKVK